MNKYYIEIRTISTYLDLNGQKVEIIGPVIETYPISEFEWENDILPLEIHNTDKERYAIYKSKRI